MWVCVIWRHWTKCLQTLHDGIFPNRIHIHMILKWLWPKFTQGKSLRLRVTVLIHKGHSFRQLSQSAGNKKSITWKLWWLDQLWPEQKLFGLQFTSWSASGAEDTEGCGEFHGRQPTWGDSFSSGQLCASQAFKVSGRYFTLVLVYGKILGKQSMHMNIIVSCIIFKTNCSFKYMAQNCFWKEYWSCWNQVTSL